MPRQHIPIALLAQLCLLFAVPIHAQSSILNVLAYGATGNGLTDDTAAINTAITACATRPAPANGCTLYFPSGIYLTTGLTLRSFLHLKGDGWGTSILQLKPNTTADVLTIPADTFNFSLQGLTLDGNSAHGGRGNCLSTAATSTGPVEWNTANKHPAPINVQKWGQIEQVIFSNCSADGVHINAYNYMLFFDNFYIFNSGQYGLYTQGTNSGFSNFQIERNGSAGIRITGANNRFTSGEVIWNGASSATEAAISVSGARNILTAIQAEDNYTSGFLDNGSDDEFLGCLSDSNGYAKANTSASSHQASGFILDGSGGVYIGDKVTSYRGHLPDGAFTTEWPYTVRNPSQSSIDISYDSTNRQPLRTNANQASSHAACIKSPGPPMILGSCSTAITETGNCTCN